MKYALALLLALLLITGGLIYYQSHNPSAALKHKTQAALNEFSATIATKDRAKISAALQALLADKAQIQLEVDFFSLGQNGGKPAAQNFDKPTFLTFIDNVLYSLTDYGYEAKLQNFSLSPDRQSADITFSSQGWAEGMSYDAGIGVNMRFTSSTSCTGHVIFATERAQLDKAACITQLHTTPKQLN